MIKKIIHLADIHIRNDFFEKQKESMKLAIAEIYKEVKKYNKDEVRIVISGDIYHQKVKSSKEAEIIFQDRKSVV